jgi:deoxycytidine triphosphate deaminase
LGVTLEWTWCRVRVIYRLERVAIPYHISFSIVGKQSPVSRLGAFHPWEVIDAGKPAGGKKTAQEFSRAIEVSPEVFFVFVVHM